MKVKPPKKVPFVYVVWHDAEHPSTGEWILREDLNKSPSLSVETGGFMVSRDRKLLQVAVSVACRGEEGEQYTGVMNIPMGCVQSIVEVAPTGVTNPIYTRKVKNGNS